MGGSFRGFPYKPSGQSPHANLHKSTLCILSNSLNSILTLYLEVTLLENASIIKRLELNFLFFRKFSAGGLLFAQRFSIREQGEHF